MSTHPLVSRAFAVGAAAGVLVAVATSSVLSGTAVFALAVMVGLTWRVDEIPVMPFVLSYQWLQVSAGYFYHQATGHFPGEYQPGDLDLAVFLSLAGLLLIALAVRLVARATARPHDVHQQWTVHNLRGLFLLVIGLYSINYVTTLSFGGGSLSVILDRLVQLRQVPLILLWIEVLRQGRHRSYLWLSLAWVFIPQLGSYFSDFKTPLLLLLIVSAFFWEPWNVDHRKITAAGLARVGGAVAAALFLAMLWQGGVKQDIRKAYDDDAVGANPFDRIQLFVERAGDALPGVQNETRDVVEGLVSRVSYVTFFSRVLEHVPAREPHADGELLQMALSNAFMPRFLFPSKGALPSDSYYTRRFAGVLVMEDNTSISIGYLAEFYADWGFAGMFLSVFAYGLLMGFAIWLLRTHAPSFLSNPAIVCTMLVVLPFEHQFVKGLASLLMAVILALVVTRVAARPLVRYLDITPDDVDEVPVTRPLRPTLRPMPRPRPVQ